MWEGPPPLSFFFYSGITSHPIITKSKRGKGAGCDLFLPSFLPGMTGLWIACSLSLSLCDGSRNDQLVELERERGREKEGVPVVSSLYLSRPPGVCRCLFITAYSSVLHTHTLQLVEPAYEIGSCVCSMFVCQLIFSSRARFHLCIITVSISMHEILIYSLNVYTWKHGHTYTKV